MTTVAVRDLRADLATHVRRAAAGEAVGVTVNGRRVAVLGPPAPAGAEGLDGLVAVGALIAPRRADRRSANGAVQVWRVPRLDLLLREIRG